MVHNLRVVDPKYCLDRSSTAWFLRLHFQRVPLLQEGIEFKLLSLYIQTYILLSQLAVVLYAASPASIPKRATASAMVNVQKISARKTSLEVGEGVIAVMPPVKC